MQLGTEKDLPELEPEYLLSEENYVYKEYLDEMKQFIMSEKWDENLKVATPRFDFMSFIAKPMQFIVYDNESFTKALGSRNMPTTAFTDFENVWINIDFLKEIIAADQAENKQGVLFLLLHEIRHNALQHNIRLQEFPHQLANWAEDMMMNIDLQEQYKDADFSSPLLCGVGFTDEEKKKYKGMSDWDIANSKMKELEKLLEKLKKQQGNSKGQGQGQSQDNGQGQGKGQGGQPSNEPGQSGGEMSAEEILQQILDDLEPGGNGAGAHLNDKIEDLVNALKDAGLGDYVDKLNLPENPDQEKERAEKIQGNLIKTIQEADRHYRENDLRPPGGHFNDYMREMVTKMKQPKASWRINLTKSVYGTGRGFRYTNDVPNNIYYVDARPLGVGHQIYTGSRQPAIKTGLAVVGIDSSGSMGNKDLAEALGAVFELASGARGRSDVPVVLVAFMDTTMRGEPFEVTRDNWQRVLKEFEAGKRGVDGRGGTHLADDMATLLESDAVKKAVKKYGKVKTLTVITDLGDRPPQLEDFPKGLPPNVTYLAVTGRYNDAFAKGVSKYAQVIDMGAKKLDIDLSKKSAPSQSRPRMFF